MIEKLNSGKAKLVYLYIYENGVVNVDDICTDLDETALSVFPILRTLTEEKNLVEKVDHRYRAI